MKKVMFLAIVAAMAIPMTVVVMAAVTPNVGTLPSGLNYYNINFVTGLTDPTCQIRVLKSGTSPIHFQWGGSFAILDSDATDGTPGVVQLPVKYYEIYDQIRGKPTTSAEWFYAYLRGTTKPIWYAHFGPQAIPPYNVRLYQGIWGGSIAGGFDTDYVNNGCSNFATKWYYYETAD